MHYTETHLHTREVSACGRLTAAEAVESYHAKGYTTLFVTDHFYQAFLDRHSELSYAEAVTLFFAGYRAAKAAGETLGMQILPGAELMLHESPNHYLLYGEVETFLLAHPELLSLSIKEAHRLAAENGLFLIQAHPYRGASVPTPEAVDGLEVRNSAPKHVKGNDEKAARLLVEQYGLWATAGSDTHLPEDVGGSGIATRTPIQSAADYRKALSGGEYVLLDWPAEAHA